MSKTTAPAAGGAMPAPASTSRRRFLGALAASPMIGAAALPALADAGPSPGPHPDAAMFGLRDKLSVVRLRISEALDRHGAAERAFAARNLPPRPRPPAMPPEDEAAMKRLCDEIKQLLGRAHLREAEAEYQARLKVWERQQKRWERKFGVPQADKELGKLWAEYGEITGSMCALPALSLAGLKAKITAWEDSDEQPDLAQSIVEDLRRGAHV